mgnify:CR=1 FL=1
MSDYLDEMRRLADRARDMARSTARRVTMGTAASSTGTAQFQGDTDETWEGTEVWSQFGLFTRAPVGSEAALLELDGNPEGAVVVATQNRSHRPSAAANEVVLHGFKASGNQATLRLYESGKIVLDTDVGGTLTMDAGGTVILESTAANPTHIGGSATSEKLIKGESYNSDTVTKFTTVAAFFTAAAAAWGGLVTFAGAVNTATNTLNGSGPPITVTHVVTWANALNTALQTLAAAASPAASAGLAGTVAANATASWYNGLAAKLTTRARGQ